MAGTKESEKCTLILTEGDSAKAPHRDFQLLKLHRYFPKGKMLNVQDIKNLKKLENTEINMIKKIGLSWKNTALSELRWKNPCPHRSG